MRKKDLQFKLRQLYHAANNVLDLRGHMSVVLSNHPIECERAGFCLMQNLAKKLDDIKTSVEYAPAILE